MLILSVPKKGGLALRHFHFSKKLTCQLMINGDFTCL
jgi:hypothetical protein